MATTVLLLSARPSFAAAWSAACAASGLVPQPVSVAEIEGLLGPGVAVAIDAESEDFDEDELLSWVGYARARGAVVAVALGDAERFSSVEDVVNELCGGLVTRETTAAVRIVEAFVRRTDEGRGGRFEYLAVAPAGDGLVAILGDGCALAVARPMASGDDRSAVEAITLASDARSAEVKLAGGTTLRLEASQLRPRGERAPAESGVGVVGSLEDIDGVKLGQRLRELRQTAGLTQAELARRTGIHRPNIARVEAGRHTPSLETLARLAAAIGVPTTRVLAG
jgi:DNA-binding XRE family transcriptional regulator